MKTENELELLGYSYYEPVSNEYQDIRKEINPVTLLFFTLVSLFGVALFLVMFFTDKLQILSGK